jgi:hypothetical protein
MLVLVISKKLRRHHFANDCQGAQSTEAAQAAWLSLARSLH